MRLCGVKNLNRAFRDKRSGFTLLESLVAITITALVLGAVAMSIGAWARANDRAREHMELNQTLQRVLNRMNQDLASIYVSPYETGALFAGFETFDIETVNQPYDAFTFTSLAHRSYRLNARESELMEMTYFTVEDEEGLGPEGTYILRHREGGIIDDSFEVEGGTVYNMATGVTHFILDYLAPDGDLKHEWRLADNLGKLPCAVVVKIGVSSRSIREVKTCAVIPIYLTNNFPCRYEPDALENLCEE